MSRAEKIEQIFKSGGLVCEYVATGYCCKMAKAYIRTAKDAKDWPNKKVPIALCEKHKGKRKRYEKTPTYTMLPYWIS